MNAIILAAGMGTRLGVHSKDKPKCLVRLGDKTLLQHQLDVLQPLVHDIVVVRGYMAQTIDVPGVHYVENAEFATTNMVASLMAAWSEFGGDCIVTYGDIVFEQRVVEQMVRSTAAVAVGIDTDFREYWTVRVGNPMLDSESLQLNGAGHIVSIGMPQPRPDQMDGRYVGILRFTDDGTSAFRSVYDKHAKCVEATGTWYQSRSFRQAYMTDMLQAMIDDGYIVHAERFQRGWLEVDTESDIEIYCRLIANGDIGRFCKLVEHNRE